MFLVPIQANRPHAHPFTPRIRAVIRCLRASPDRGSSNVRGIHSSEDGIDAISHRTHVSMAHIRPIEDTHSFVRLPRLWRHHTCASVRFTHSCDCATD